LKYDEGIISSSDEKFTVKVKVTVWYDASITNPEFGNLEANTELDAYQKNSIKKEIEKALKNISGSNQCITVATNDYGDKVNAKKQILFSFRKPQSSIKDW
jgi:hypothetical protein